MIECPSWEKDALQKECRAAKLAELGPDNVDVDRGPVIKVIRQHTCSSHNHAEERFSTQEQLCYYVLQQVLLNKLSLPYNGVYRKLDILQTMAFCNEEFVYSAASTKVSPPDSTQ